MTVPWKPLVGALAGLGMGWHLAGGSDPVSPAIHDGSSPATVEVMAHAPPKTGLVTIDKSELDRVLLESMTAKVSCDQYSGRHGTIPTGHSAFTTRLGLTEKQLEVFHRIMKQAADDRLAWEKAHAKVRNVSPGEWVIHIPGDGGLADRRLMERLSDSFGPDIAERIELGVDLAGFFNLQGLDPNFRHGTLHLKARRERNVGRLASLFPEERIRMAVESGETVVGFHLNDGSRSDGELQWRLGRLIGGEDAIRGQAPLHHIDPLDGAN